MVTVAVFFLADVFDVEEKSVASIGIGVLLIPIALALVIKSRKSSQETDKKTIRIHNMRIVDSTGYIFFMLGLVLCWNQEKWGIEAGFEKAVLVLSFCILGFASWMRYKLENQTSYLYELLLWVVLLCYIIFLFVTGGSVSF